jgi:hypothetical protein
MRMISNPLIVAEAVLMVLKPRTLRIMAFQRAMIGLDEVIEVFGRAMPDCVSRLACALQPADRLGI